MAEKRTPSKPKRKAAVAIAQPSLAASAFVMATHNMVNMVAVAAISGVVLLTLLAIRHF